MKTLRRSLWPLSVGLFGVFASVVCEPVASAEVEAEAVQGAAPAHRLEASESRWGVGIQFTNSSVELWTCSDDTCRRPSAVSVHRLPEGLTEEKRHVERLQSDGEAAWWVRVGQDEKFFSLVVVGAQREDDVAPGAPRVVLRGWAGTSPEVGTTIARQSRGTKDRLTIKHASKTVACGRSTPRVTRIFDPATGKARRVQAPVLSRDERRQAKTLKALPAGERPQGLDVGLDPATKDSAKRPVDGDRKKPWAGSFQFVELKAPQGADLRKLAIEVSAPQDKDTALYLATSSQVVQLVLPAHSGVRYLVDAPEPVGDCVALVQPKTVAPVAEVMGVMPHEGQAPTPDELIDQLEKGDPGLALAALRLHGATASKLLYGRYRKLSQLGRRRALDFAARSVPEVAAPVLVAGVLHGSEHEEEEAFEQLQSLDVTGVKAVEAALRGYRGKSRARLVSALARLSPERAVRVLPKLFDRAEPSLREALSRTLEGLQSDRVGKVELRKLVRKLADGQSDLSSSTQIEIARSLGPILANSKSATSWIERLAAQAGFREAYLLAPQVLDLSRSSPVLRKRFGGWLVGKGAGKLSRLQEAALSVHLLELLTDRGGSSDDAGKQGRLRGNVERMTGLLASDNMRVRRGALVAATGLGVRLPRDDVEELFVEDEWPQVRAVAARGLLKSVDDASRDSSLNKLLVKRLAKDDHHSVRRAVARTLVSLPGEQTLKGLRRSYRKDESYSVRAEAAVSLGKLCDVESLDKLTQSAQALATGLTDEGQIELGLSSVTALAYLAPKDLDRRLAPLLSKEMPGITRQQVKRRLEAVASQKKGSRCQR